MGLMLALLLALGTAGPGLQSNAKTDQCLACHGPFEKLAKDTADYKAPSGETGTPHRYVPHDTKQIPECTECHKQHPVPLEDPAKVEKTGGVEWCYSGCHHTSDLEKCPACH